MTTRAAQRRDPDMQAGRSRQPRRDVHGIVLLDKPRGISSNDALQRVKRAYRAQKAGHTGNLDVLASGLLPVCLGEATKFSGYLLDAQKRYGAEFKLGVATTTGDAEGEITRQAPVPAIDVAALDRALDAFRGEIAQTPPMFSAIKHRGQPLYKLAHKGIEVAREARPVTVYRYELCAWDHDRLVVEVDCSKGTYIRTLAEDLGELLQCGAYVTVLRRVGVGPFDIGDAMTLAAIEDLARDGTTGLDRLLLPVDSALAALPRVVLSPDSAHHLALGQPVVGGGLPPHGSVRLYDHEQHFLGVGEVRDDGRVAPRRLLRQTHGPDRRGEKN